MKNHKASSSSRRQGFSLAEMLMTVAIIGIMAMLALPTFGNTEPAKQGVNKQNAQNFCSLAFAISSAGVDLTGNVNFANNGSDEVKAVLRILVEGVTVTSGTLAGRNFRVPNVSPELIAGASKYVSIKDGELMYNGGLSL
ncbi:MAG: prepilin-type N-terminal cleavage/methylation domain-containing protein [Verrucomicrobiota bacterium]